MREKLPECAGAAASVQSMGEATCAETQLPQRSPSCSFCRRSYPETGALAQGPDAYICLSCAEECARVIRRDYERRRSQAASGEENENPFRAPLETRETSGDTRAAVDSGQYTMFIPYLALLLSVVVLCTVYQTRMASLIISCAEGCVLFFLLLFVASEFRRALAAGHRARVLVGAILAIMAVLLHCVWSFWIPPRLFMPFVLVIWLEVVCVIRLAALTVSLLWDCAHWGATN